jgi:hypothetical protein
MGGGEESNCALLQPTIARIKRVRLSSERAVVFGAEEEEKKEK